MKLSQSAIRLRTTVRDTIYYIATVAPTATDDRNDNFIVGSRWINTTTLDEYVCVDNIQTGAVWKPTTTGGGGGGTSAHVATVDPTNLDDSGAGYPIGTLWVNTTDNTAFISVDSTNDSAIWTLISERIPTASEIPATPSVNNAGTTVQAQLDILSTNIIGIGLGALAIIRAYLTSDSFIDDDLHMWTINRPVTPISSVYLTSDSFIDDDLHMWTINRPVTPISSVYLTSDSFIDDDLHMWTVSRIPAPIVYPTTNMVSI